MFFDFFFSKIGIPWRLFLKDPFIWISGLAGAILNVSIWALIFLKMPRAEVLPLHYNIYFGFDRFGPWYWALIIPASGSVVFLIHLFLAHSFYKKELFISRLLSVSGAALEGIFFAAGLIALLLNL